MCCRRRWWLTDFVVLVIAKENWCEPRFHFDCLGNRVEQTTKWANNPANPFRSIYAGSFASPAFGDWDADSDIDLIVGNGDGELKYYERTSTQSLELRTDAADPFHGLIFHTKAKPSLVDWDGDGDLDVVVQDSAGYLQMYERIGKNTVAQSTFDANPFANITILATSRPGFLDWDGDQDLDMALTSPEPGSLQYYERVGAKLERRTGTANPFTGIQTEFQSNLKFVLSFDNQYDLVIGNVNFGSLKYYQYVGGPLVYIEDELHPWTTIKCWGSFDIVDWDGDGALDLAWGTSSGRLNYIARKTVRHFTRITGSPNPFNGIGESGVRAVPNFVDWDGDGDLDMFVNEYDLSSYLAYYENVGDLRLEKREGLSNPVWYISLDWDACSVFVDWDNDGDLDLVIGSRDNGTISYYERTNATYFEIRKEDENPFNGIQLKPLAGNRLAFADWGEDGDLDLFISDGGSLQVYERTGTNTLGIANNLSVNPGDTAVPTFVDWDEDGDLDLIIANKDNKLTLYKRVGPSELHAGILLSESGGGEDIGINLRPGSAPVFVDWDGDNDLDLVIGNRDRELMYFIDGCEQAALCTRRGNCQPTGLCYCLDGYTGRANCGACSAGFSQSLFDGEVFCNRCDPGKSAIAGSTYCSECEAGKFAGVAAATCTDCPQGKYAANLSSICTDCVAGRDSHPKSTSPDECFCKAGSYWDSQNLRCDICEGEGYYCQGGFQETAHSLEKPLHNPPESEKGYFMTAVAVAVPCALTHQGDSACLGHESYKRQEDSCARGHTGPLCGSCRRGFTLDAVNAQCFDCATGSTERFVVSLIAHVLVKSMYAIIVAKLSQITVGFVARSGRRAALIRQVTQLLSTCAVLAYIDWDKVARIVENAGRTFGTLADGQEFEPAGFALPSWFGDFVIFIFAFNIGLPFLQDHRVSLGCLVDGIALTEKTRITLILSWWFILPPIVCLGILLILIITVKIPNAFAYHRAHQKENIILGFFRDTNIFTILSDGRPIFLLGVYQSWDLITTESIKSFACIRFATDGAQRRVYAADTQEPCLETQRSAIGILNIGFWSFGFLLAIFLGILRKRRKTTTNSSELLRNFGYFYIGFKKNAWWWELVVKRADWFVFLFISTSSTPFDTIQAKLSAYVIAAGLFLLLHVLCHPYFDVENCLLHRLELYGLSSRFFLMTAMQLLLVVDTPLAQAVAFVFAFICCIVTILVCCLYGFFIFVDKLSKTTEALDKAISFSSHSSKSKRSFVQNIYFVMLMRFSVLPHELNQLRDRTYRLGWTREEKKLQGIPGRPPTREDGTPFWHRWWLKLLWRLYHLDDSTQIPYCCDTLRKFDVELIMTHNAVPSDRTSVLVLAVALRNYGHSRVVDLVEFLDVVKDARELLRVDRPAENGLAASGDDLWYAVQVLQSLGVADSRRLMVVASGEMEASMIKELRDQRSTGVMASCNFPNADQFEPRSEEEKFVQSDIEGISSYGEALQENCKSEAREGSTLLRQAEPWKYHNVDTMEMSSASTSGAVFSDPVHRQDESDAVLVRPLVNSLKLLEKRSFRVASHFEEFEQREHEQFSAISKELQEAEQRCERFEDAVQSRMHHEVSLLPPRTLFPPRFQLNRSEEIDRHFEPVANAVEPCESAMDNLSATVDKMERLVLQECLGEEIDSDKGRVANELKPRKSKMDNLTATANKTEQRLIWECFGEEIDEDTGQGAKEVESREAEIIADLTATVNAMEQRLKEMEAQASKAQLREHDAFNAGFELGRNWAEHHYEMQHANSSA